jgi:hypothetical protein
MVCGHCKNQITESRVRFCPFCGYELVSVQKSAPAASIGAGEEALVPARCTTTKLPFIVRFHQTGPAAFIATSAFPVKEEHLRNPAFSGSQLRIKGYATGENYTGCPYCGSRGFWIDHSCGGRICCHDGHTVRAVCPWCGSMGNLTRVESVALRGMKGT